jgi:asparagine synthase (glutamine-hydrolysing)
MKFSNQTLANIKNILTLRYNPENKTIFNSINETDLSINQQDENGEITEKLIIDLFKRSIPNKTKKISVSLSSGIDSTLCLALLREAFPKLEIISFCGVFDENNEVNLSSKIAQKFDSDFRIVKIDSIFKQIPKMVQISGEPRWNVYHYRIAEEAKKESDILINGDGADELFAGYVFRYDKFLNLVCDNDDWLSLTKKYLDCHERDWIKDQKKFFGNNIKFHWNDIYLYFKKYFNNNLSPIQKVMLADFNGKLLHDFIPTGRSISNFYNLKFFSPFLQHDLIKFANHLPLSSKYDSTKNLGKLVLRSISKRYGIKHVKNKIGFSPNLIKDWYNGGKDMCFSILDNNESEIYKNRLIDYNWMKTTLADIDNNMDFRIINKLISSLTLEIWINQKFKNTNIV